MSNLRFLTRSRITGATVSPTKSLLRRAARMTPTRPITIK